MLVNFKDMLKKAQEEKFAVGLFNTTDTDMLQAAIEAAEKARSPIIIGTAEVLLPSGELSLIAPSVLAMARAAKVPVTVHYDHGLTFPRCMEALKLGFSSVMFDGSAGDPETNIRETANVVRICHAFGATVEGEIGHVGNADTADNAVDDLYTTPEEAVEYIAATGVDALAIAIGTAHGAYKVKPKLDIERLRKIRSATDTPLVLHGGSGLTDEDFRTAIENGIAKVNIFTDLCNAGKRAMAEGLALDESYLAIRDRKMAAIREEVIKKMTLFGSVGKA